MRDKFAKCPPPLIGYGIVSALAKNRGVELCLKAPDGRTVQESFDHVIAATGYRVDLRRLTFLDPALQARLARVNENSCAIEPVRVLGKGTFLCRSCGRQQLRPADAICVWREVRFAPAGLPLARQPSAAHSSSKDPIILDNKAAGPSPS